MCYLPFLHNCLWNLLAISQWKLLVILWKPFKYLNHEISLIYCNNIATTKLNGEQIKTQKKQVSPKRLQKCLNCAQISLQSKDINLNSSKSLITLYSYCMTWLLTYLWEVLFLFRILGETSWHFRRTENYMSHERASWNLPRLYNERSGTAGLIYTHIDQVLQVWSTHTSIRSARLRSEANQIS